MILEIGAHYRKYHDHWYSLNLSAYQNPPVSLQLSRGKEVLTSTSGNGLASLYNNGETMRPSINNTCHISTRLGFRRLEKIPLIPAIRPMPSSKIIVATPSIIPPTKEIGVNACQSICILIRSHLACFLIC